MAYRHDRSKIDTNQQAIVKALRRIPGVTVEVSHDDILCGRNGVTYWFEIKEPEKCLSKKTGKLLISALKPSQVELLDKWTGHYSVVWSLDQILKEIGIKTN